MKNIRKILAGLFSISMLLFFVACQEEDHPIPTASTQASFTWSIDTLMDADVIIGFGVQFHNQSIKATSYSWDFDNGQTSTEENPYTEYTESGQYTVRLTVGSEHDLHYNRLVRTATLTLATGALPIPYVEDFSTEEDIPEMMTTWDLDGDGFNWYWGQLADGSSHLRSQSWDPDEGALTPDNWVITPLLELGSLEEGEQIFVNLNVGVFANTPAFRQEHYGVFVSQTTMEPDAFEMVYEETFTQDTPRLEPLPRKINISQFAGQNVYVAVRHFDVTDMDRMFLDRIEVVRE